MDNLGFVSADVEAWTLVNYLEEGGFSALLWDTLKDFGYTASPEYSTREVMTTGQLLHCEVKVKILTCPTNPAWEEWECKAQGLNLANTMQKAALEALTTLCGKHPAVVADTAAKVIPVSNTLYLVSNTKLFSQLRATPSTVRSLSPQFIFWKPCTTPTNGWWEKVCSIDTKSISTELKKWRTPLKR
jgi:hypothetical protein